MGNEINIPNTTPPKNNNVPLIIQSFGINVLQTAIYKGKINVAEKDKSTVGRKSQLGTSIFSELRFGDVYKKVKGGYDLIEHKFPIDLALFSVSQVKNIVITQVNGRDGDITTYNGMSSYRINVKGRINGKNGVYPKDDVENLIKFLEYDQSIPISSPFLNDIFDIQEVVVLNYDINQDEGGHSYQKFEINLKSEKPVEILIQEQK